MNTLRAVNISGLQMAEIRLDVKAGNMWCNWVTIHHIYFCYWDTQRCCCRYTIILVPYHWVNRSRYVTVTRTLDTLKYLTVIKAMAVERLGHNEILRTDFNSFSLVSICGSINGTYIHFARVVHPCRCITCIDVVVNEAKLGIKRLGLRLSQYKQWKWNEQGLICFLEFDFLFRKK